MVLKTSKYQMTQQLTVIHLHLSATSRTVFSRSVAAILMYFMILGSLENLSWKRVVSKCIKNNFKKRKEEMDLKHTTTYKEVDVLVE